jgi:hypothetical protein
MLIKRWQGPPVLVIVPCPPEPSVAIGAPKGGGPVWCWIPEGSIAPRALTNAEKKFLLRQRMDGGLFKSGRVLAVSKEAASRFETDRKARVDLAKKCGLNRSDDLFRITAARRKLAAFRPKSFNERRAAWALRELLCGQPPKKEPGRPGSPARVTYTVALSSGMTPPCC